MPGLVYFRCIGLDDVWSSTQWKVCEWKARQLQPVQSRAELATCLTIRRFDQSCAESGNCSGTDKSTSGECHPSSAAVQAT